MSSRVDPCTVLPPTYLFVSWKYHLHIRTILDPSKPNTIPWDYTSLRPIYPSKESTYPSKHTSTHIPIQVHYVCTLLPKPNTITRDYRPIYQDTYLYTSISLSTGVGEVLTSRQMYETPNAYQQRSTHILEEETYPSIIHSSKSSRCPWSIFIKEFYIPGGHMLRHFSQ
jgi:hypothetical protein